MNTRCSSTYRTCSQLMKSSTSKSVKTISGQSGAKNLQRQNLHCGDQAGLWVHATRPLRCFNSHVQTSAAWQHGAIQHPVQRFPGVTKQECFRGPVGDLTLLAVQILQCSINMGAGRNFIPRPKGGSQKIFAHKPMFKPFKAISTDRPTAFRSE
jgi:hypothetical protein